MSQYNSSVPFGVATASDLQEALGIPQFSGSASTDWYLVFNGLIIQGGYIELPAASTAFPFVTAFTQQVLGVFIQSELKGQTPGVVSTTLTGFTVDHSGAIHDAYWWAIGV